MTGIDTLRKKIKNTDSKVELFHELSQHEKVVLEDYLKFAIYLRESGSASDSFGVLAKAETKFGKNAWIEDNRARAYMDLNRVDEAVKCWNNAIHIAPGGDKDYFTAEQEIAKKFFSESNASYLFEHLNEAARLREEGRIDQSMLVLNKLSDTYGKYLWIEDNKARCYWLLKEYDAALNAWDRALECAQLSCEEDVTFIENSVASLRKNQTEAIVNELTSVLTSKTFNPIVFNKSLADLKIIALDLKPYSSVLNDLAVDLQNHSYPEYAKQIHENIACVDSRHVQKVINILSKDEESEPAANDLLYGDIEKLEAGVLYGWAASKIYSHSLAINVVTHEHGVIGQGYARYYRPELKHANIHEGVHGFKIELNEVWGANLERGVKLMLEDAKSGRRINHSKFEMQTKSRRYSGIIHRVDNGRISISISSNQVLGQYELVLFHEDTAVYKESFSSDSNSAELTLPLPISLMDGTRKLLKLGITGYPHIIATQWLEVHPIETPWRHLKDSFKQSGFMSIPKQASFRYESLEYHLEALAKEEAYLSLQDLMITHQLVVEGYEGRHKFPKFALPEFSSPRVSIIVPAYNKFELSYHCIASIALAFNKTSYEVILADDCSEDETLEAESIISNLVVSRNPENLRFLLSCNRASELAKGEFIVFLNNDTEVTSFWLDELVNKLVDDSTIGMTGSKLLNLDGTQQEAGGIVWGTGQAWNVGREVNAYLPEYNYAREVDYLTGAALCIRSHVWQEVGRFSEEFAPCYYEDTDLAFKVRGAGYKTVYVPHSQVIHFEGQSHGTDITKGLKQYQIVNEQKFKAKWYKAFKNNGQQLSLEHMSTEKDRNIDNRILVIDYATPMPNKDAGGYAAVEEIKLIQSLGFKVTFVAENLAHFGKYTVALQRMGVEVLYAPFYMSVHDVIQKRIHEMDAVYITRYTVAEKYIDSIKAQSEAKILFNNADLHFLRTMRSALKGNKDKELMQKAIKIREAELAVCNQVDAVLCYNSTEHAVIMSHILDMNKFHITPWVLEQKSSGPEFNQRQGISFLGGYNHFPNVEAVEYLATKIMPLLATRRPEICLSVYGSNMPKTFNKFAAGNIKMVGFAESLDQVFQDHRIFVAPLLSGAGIKGKVLESVAYGTPTVLTEIAAEGTGLTHGISTLIAESPEAWVDAIIRLYDDQALWERFSENEHLLLEAKYSFAHGRNKFKEIFASVGLYSTY